MPDGSHCFGIEHLEGFIFRHYSSGFSQNQDADDPYVDQFERLLDMMDLHYPGQDCHFIYDMSNWKGVGSKSRKVGMKKHGKWLNRNYGSVALVNAPFMARVFAKLATSFQPNLQVSFHTSQTSALAHLREHTKQMRGLGICSKVNITYRPNWQHELKAEGSRHLALNLSLSDQISSGKKTIDFQSNKKEILASQVRSLARELELNRHHLAHLF